MNITRQVMAFAVVSALTGTAMAYDPGVTVANRQALASSSEAYWTTDRVASAQPLLPTRDSGGLISQSFGTANLDFTRSRITPQSANKARPYRSVGKLYFSVPGQGDFQCSASVIKNRLIVTAAHCLYTDGIGWHTNWAFIPGFDGTKAPPANRPYGTWNWSHATIPTAWVTSAGALPNNEDFGLLELVDQATPPSAVTRTVGATVGKLNVEIGHLSDTHVTMLGYPCNFDSCAIMQRNDAGDHRGSGVAGSTAYEYGSDMTGGSSGGPWVENFGDPAAAAPTGSRVTRNAVVGVTSYGYTDPNVKILGASQFNANFQSILNSTCALAPGNC
ncbi:trypsin-like serine peptidase [Methylotetracoccus oryzae]|uniref:trypsin-like serine peptidase n=1 Tax=Methylotetracoccus oryzae TaxID=1919059 RepID=UPI001118D8B5|nr:trypsin-like serine protease [Methylotetracoccus oryzae]